MDWIKKVNFIKEKLVNEGLSESAIKITNAQMILGTPGEMYLEVVNLLLNWKRESSAEYRVVALETEELLEYGKSIGYFIP